MSFTSKLLFDNKEINILDFNYTLRQQSDYSGRPIAKPRLLGLSLVIEATKDTELLDWMIHHSMRKQIKIRIESRAFNGKSRTLEFIDACCVDYTEHFENNSTRPMTLRLHITSAAIKEGNTELSEHWRTTFPTSTPITEREEEDTEPKVVDYYITDLEGNKKPEYEIGDEIYVVIKTKNMTGKELTLNLADKTKDFRYKDEVLPNDRLENYQIRSNTEKIKLEVIPQQNSKQNG